MMATHAVFTSAFYQIREAGLHVRLSDAYVLDIDQDFANYSSNNFLTLKIPLLIRTKSKIT